MVPACQRPDECAPDVFSVAVAAGAFVVPTSMSMTLLPEQEAWIEALVATGDFAFVEEAARQLIDHPIAAKRDSRVPFAARRLGPWGARIHERAAAREPELLPDAKAGQWFSEILWFGRRMMKQPTLKPTVVIPDTAPLIHLAAGDALTVLNAMGRVVVPDIVHLEATYFREKPYAAEIAAWIEAGQTPGSNQPVEIAETEIGGLYRIALDQDLPRPRNAGEIGIVTWLSDNLPRVGGPALVIYENARVPNMLTREGVAAIVAVATTRNMLLMAEQQGIIPDAEALWRRITAAMPTASPVSNVTLIHPIVKP